EPVAEGLPTRSLGDARVEKIAGYPDDPRVRALVALRPLGADRCRLSGSHRVGRLSASRAGSMIRRGAHNTLTTSAVCGGRGLAQPRDGPTFDGPFRSHLAGPRIRSSSVEACSAAEPRARFARAGDGAGGCGAELSAASNSSHCSSLTIH